MRCCSTVYQESWLLNKTSELSSVSLDSPYLCPYFARTITTDDETDEQPPRAKSFVPTEFRAHCVCAHVYIHVSTLTHVNVHLRGAIHVLARTTFV